MPVYAACRQRFQVHGGQMIVSCWCGMSSIANCRQCGAALCGDHFFRADTGEVVCAVHALERQDEAKQLTQVREAAQREEQAVEDGPAVMRLLAIEDPLERILRLVAAGDCSAPVPNSQHTIGAVEPTVSLPRYWDRVCPDLGQRVWRGDEDFPDIANLARWFANTARDCGFRPLGGTTWVQTRTKWSGEQVRTETFEPATEWTFLRCATWKGGENNDRYWYVRLQEDGTLEDAYANAFMVFLFADVFGWRTGRPLDRMDTYYRTQHFNTGKYQH